MKKRKTKKNFLHFFPFCDHKNPPEEREFNELKTLWTEIISEYTYENKNYTKYIMILAKCLLFSVFFARHRSHSIGMLKWAQCSNQIDQHIQTTWLRVCMRLFFADKCSNLFNRSPFPNDNIQRNRMEWMWICAMIIITSHWWMWLAFPNFGTECIESSMRCV